MPGRRSRFRCGFVNYEFLIYLELYAIAAGVLLPFLARTKARHPGHAIAIDFLLIAFALPGVWLLAVVAIRIAGNIADMAREGLVSFQRKISH